MSKSDLINYLKIHEVHCKFRIGNIGEIQQCKEVNTKGYGYFNLDTDYTEDLNHISDNRFDIIEVYIRTNNYFNGNDVIEQQYEELKNGIRFRIENNITDDWEQLYHCIDVLCEKHKARIRDIENGICSIEKFKQQLAEKEKEVEQLNNRILISQLQAPEEQILKIIGSSCCQYNPNQDKISFCIDKLNEVKEYTDEHWWVDGVSECIVNFIDNKITELRKEQKR